MFNWIIEFKVTAINNFSTWINEKKRKTGLEIEELKGKKHRKKENTGDTEIWNSSKHNHYMAY